MLDLNGLLGRARSHAVVALLFLGSAAACSDPAQQAMLRGDRFLGEGQLDAAIAEYRLAMRQGEESPEILLKLGHAYARSGEVDESVRLFEALLERDSSYRYQVASELSEVARRALDRGARENMRRALRPLATWNLGLIPADLRLVLARLDAEDGEYSRALPLYFSVLGDTVDLDPAVHYEVGRAYEELGGCKEALFHFERYLTHVGRRSEEASGARWHLGNCLFLAAEEDRAAGRPRSALEKLEKMVALSVPLTLLDRAHYHRGELLLGLGNPDGALEAFRTVLRLNPSRTGFLSRRAEERIREIRHGREDV